MMFSVDLSKGEAAGAVMNFVSTQCLTLCAALQQHNVSLHGSSTAKASRRHTHVNMQSAKATEAACQRAKTKRGFVLFHTTNCNTEGFDSSREKTTSLQTVTNMRLLLDNWDTARFQNHQPPEQLTLHLPMTSQQRHCHHVKGARVIVGRGILWHVIVFAPLKENPSGHIPDLQTAAQN